jgi:hypothetical protein
VRRRNGIASESAIFDQFMDNIETFAASRPQNLVTWGNTNGHT